MAAKREPELTPEQDHRRRLEQLRDDLRNAIDRCSENMLPQLSGQYRATLADIAALPPAVAAAPSVRDELRAQRERRTQEGAPTGKAPRRSTPAPVPATRRASK